MSVLDAILSTIKRKNFCLGWIRSPYSAGGLPDTRGAGLACALQTSLKMTGTAVAPFTQHCGMLEGISGTKNFEVVLFFTVFWLLCTMWECSPRRVLSPPVPLLTHSSFRWGRYTVQRYWLFLFSSFSCMFRLDFPWYLKTFCYQSPCSPESHRHALYESFLSWIGDSSRT